MAEIFDGGIDLEKMRERMENDNTDWKHMYLTLFNAVTDAIEILQKAQQECEDKYINTP